MTCIEFLNFSFKKKKKILPFNKQKYFKCPQESHAINNVFFFFHTCIALKKNCSIIEEYTKET